MMRMLALSQMLIGIIFIGCVNTPSSSPCKHKNDEICEALNCVDLTYPLITFDQPALSSIIPEITEGYNAFNFEERLGDTLIIFQIHYNSDTGKCYVLDYQKMFEDSAFRYMLLVNNNDTAYFVKQDKVTREEIFIVGEYFFRAMHSLMTKEERRYFELYQDSLMKVRGDDLPSLPSLTEEEQKLYDNL